MLALTCHQIATKLRTIRQEQGQLKSRIRDLEEQLHPTVHDKLAFAELMQMFPWSGGLMPYLDAEFNGKRWEGKHVHDLYVFHSKWRERYFDDPQVQTVFAEFQQRCEDLAGWLAEQGAPDPRIVSLPDGDTLYTIASGSEREGGWPAFDMERGRGFEAADAVLKARRQLERIGRERGL